MIDWYFKQGHMEYGPVKGDEIAILACNGHISHGTPVRTNCSAEWVKAESLPALKEFFPAAPLAAPPAIRHEAAAELMLPENVRREAVPPSAPASLNKPDTPDDYEEFDAYQFGDVDAGDKRELVFLIAAITAVLVALSVLFWVVFLRENPNRYRHRNLYSGPAGTVTEREA